MTTAAAPARQRTFLGHPIGLYVLFFTEMWERFSYYGMRALLLLYMVNYFKWGQKDASTVYKIYTSFVYVTPILGGYLADRYLGNRRAVIIGAILMAIGHFLMAFEDFPIFLSALGFLILGNGFFKPNMSVQVGRLYATNDGRRDGAYTIFYMGINLGALSPVICGWLEANTVGGYHSGFTIAGIGMVLGLIVYLLGQPFIKELPPDTLIDKTGDTKSAGAATAPAAADESLTEAQAERAPSILGGAASMVPGFLYLVGGALLGLALVLIAAIYVSDLAAQFGPFRDYVGPKDISNLSNKVMIAITGFCFVLMGYVASQVTGGMRDRVLAILVLGFFVVFFWAAYEQAGNVLNVWADQSTNRFLTQKPQPPNPIPEVIELKGEQEAEEAGSAGLVKHFLNLFPNMVTLKSHAGSQEPKLGQGADSEPKGWGETIVSWFNPLSTATFQAINSAIILVLAPLFAWLWVFLDRRGKQPSIPFKMTVGLVFMSVSMAIMVAAAKEENRRSEVDWARPMPTGIHESVDHQLTYTEESKEVPFHAGRLTFEGKKFILFGVLDKNECDHLIEETAPLDYAAKVKELRKESESINGKEVKSVAVELTKIPPGFDMKFAGIKSSFVKFEQNGTAGKLIAYQPLATKEVKGLLVAGGDPEFRTTIHQLWIESTTFRVSSWWLFWSYVFATVGELCLSPVGLSMVSKLAPAKFATMLMGVWLLTNSFGNFAAGAMGEVWGTIPPIDFFLWATGILGGSALALFVIVRIVTAAMHGVK